MADNRERKIEYWKEEERCLDCLMKLMKSMKEKREDWLRAVVNDWKTKDEDENLNKLVCRQVINERFMIVMKLLLKI